jgi:uncharacterized coiled-coil DUF342 family protein
MKLRAEGPASASIRAGVAASEIANKNTEEDEVEEIASNTLCTFKKADELRKYANIVSDNVCEVVDAIALPNLETELEEDRCEMLGYNSKIKECIEDTLTYLECISKNIRRL